VFLSNQNIQKIIDKIVSEGRELYLKALCVNSIVRVGEPAKCPVCHNIMSAQQQVFMLTDVNGVPQFEDCFDSHVCADRATIWLHHILAIYKEFLKPVETVKLLEIFLLDPRAIKEDEDFRHFLWRFKKHMEHLEENPPQLAIGDNPGG